MATIASCLPAFKLFPKLSGFLWQRSDWTDVLLQVLHMISSFTEGSRPDTEFRDTFSDIVIDRRIKIAKYVMTALSFRFHK